ncbi:SMP-30/gluconolactonase/LRE family protein [Actinomadura rugatobispora]|uniref:SMP-30/gluconolactonase/LRE family protein n=1 Tax=Actinomadura rugatobispora TaxID=1994 RepID=A0ABW1A2T7_9ACTN|nr:SMP-30/gluconolactonase/LRE family protein [Actinomadura rugatobispora]
MSGGAEVKYAGPETLTVVTGGHSFLEGPRWHDGALYVSDFYTHRVLRIALGATGSAGPVETVAEIEGRPSGLGWDAEGRLLVVSMLDRTLYRVSGGVPEPVADLGALATGPCNDMLVDGQGRAYVGNFGGDGEADSPLVDAVLARVDPDGTVTAAADGLRFPNGVALTPGGTLLVAETYGARITAFDVAPDGALTGRRVWADLSRDGLAATARGMIATGAVLPDGIALDSEGALWVADAAGSGAVRVREGGEITERVGTGDLTAFSVALGGPDGRTLFLCASPRLFETDYPNDHRSAVLSRRVDVPA